MRSSVGPYDDPSPSCRKTTMAVIRDILEFIGLEQGHREMGTDVLMPVL